MGVTYKLRKDVVDLIIDKKKEEPSLSCRKIVAIVRETFQLDVSKSSINAVIKEYNLSNPVGRASSKNFFIPKNKKEQLLADVKPFLLNSKVDNISLDTFEHISALETGNTLTSEVEISTPVSIEVVESIQDEKIEQATLSPDLLAIKPAGAIQYVKENASYDLKDDYIWAGNTRPIIKNLGISILYVALLDILRTQVIQEAFVEVGGIVTDDRCLLEAAILLTGLGYECVEKIDLTLASSVWTLLGQDCSQVDSSFFRVFNKKIELALEVELATAVMGNAYFSLQSGKSQRYLLSHDLGYFLDKAPSGNVCSMIKAVENAVDRVVCPVKPLVLRCSAGLTEAVKELLIFLSGSDEEKPVKICLWGDGEHLLWEDSLDPLKQINYIIGFNVESDFFEKIIFDETGLPQEGYNVILDQYYSMIHGRCHFTYAGRQSETLKGLVVKVPGNEKRLFLMTNMVAKQSSVKDIVEQYLEKFFYLENFNTENGDTSGNRPHDLQVERIDHTTPGMFLKKMMTV
ncbi:MAG: hypothetical protein WCI27_11805, partial [Candidatus Omnitrophota bacterium]